ncbi:MAG: tetratricopeptide (TPR) repeat protein [Cellvibrionaceae bacterium]|jgi:tetratricopeptide (TPR) repeat protein
MNDLQAISDKLVKFYTSANTDRVSDVPHGSQTKLDHIEKQILEALEQPGEATQSLLDLLKNDPNPDKATLIELLNTNQKLVCQFSILFQELDQTHQQINHITASDTDQQKEIPNSQAPLNSGDISIAGDNEGVAVIGNRNRIVNTIIKVVQAPETFWSETSQLIKSNKAPLALIGLSLILLTVTYQTFKDLYLISLGYFLWTALAFIAAIWCLFHLVRKNNDPHNSRNRIVFNFIIPFASVSSLLGLTGFQVNNIVNPIIYDPDRFVIAIGTLGDESNYSQNSLGTAITQRIYDSLCQSVDDQSDQFTDPCNETIAESTGELLVNPIAVAKVGVLKDRETAEQVGRNMNADVIVWGNLRLNEENVSIDYKILETIDNAVNPEYPLVLPVTNRETQIQFSTKTPLSRYEVEQFTPQMAENIADYTLALKSYLDRDYADAVNHFSNIIDSLNINLDQCDALLDEDRRLSAEGLSWLYYYLGRSSFQILRPEEGMKWLHCAETLNAEEPAITHSLALGFGVLGETEGRDQKFLEALTKIDRWLSTHSDDAIAYYNRAEINRVLDSPTNRQVAENNFELAIENDAELLVARVSYAQFLIESDGIEGKPRYAEAETVLLKTLEEFDPAESDLSWIYLGLGMVFSAQGQLIKAEKAFEDAVSQDLKDNYLYLKFSEFLAGIEKVDKALEMYDNFIKYSHNKAKSNEIKGDYLLSLGRALDAIQHFEISIAETQENCVPYAKMADAYFIIGDLESATANFELSISRKPCQSTYPHRLFVFRLIELGEHKRAMEVALIAAILNPTDSYSLDMVKFIYQSQNDTEGLVFTENCIVLRDSLPAKPDEVEMSTYNECINSLKEFSISSSHS